MDSSMNLQTWSDDELTLNWDGADGGVQIPALLLTSCDPGSPTSVPHGLCVVLVSLFEKWSWGPEAKWGIQVETLEGAQQMQAIV